MQNLTDQQIEEFYKEGFLLVKNCFSDVEIAEMMTIVKKFNAKKPDDWKKGEEMAYYETSKINSDAASMFCFKLILVNFSFVTIFKNLL